jgi:hypothetical protein
MTIDEVQEELRLAIRELQIDEPARDRLIKLSSRLQWGIE